jgi:RIO kinase 1
MSFYSFLLKTNQVFKEERILVISMSKITREKFKTYGNVFDDFTNRNLFKLISQGYFEEMKSPIALGKEANIFTAVKKDGTRVIVKIYRLETCDFNRMYEYMKSDDRYHNVKKTRRNVIFAWTQREYRNLHKAREAGLKVPMPHHFMNNILIEEFIGKDDPAPKLKDCAPENPEKFFKKTVEYMRLLYKAGLVHGDLSPFNILNYEDDPVFIDFSQATITTSSVAKELLERDVNNVCSYFKKLGMKIDQEKITKNIKS